MTWVLVTVMVFTALFARRNNYELFYYTHHIAIIFYVVAIMHAWSFWYAATPCMRWVRANLSGCTDHVHTHTHTLSLTLTVQDVREASQT